MKKTILRWIWYVFLICIIVALLNLPTVLSYVSYWEDFVELNQGEGLPPTRIAHVYGMFVYDVSDGEAVYNEQASFHSNSWSKPVTDEDLQRVQEILSRIRYSIVLPPQKFPTEKNNRYVYVEDPVIHFYPTHYSVSGLYATCPGYREIFADLEQLAEEIRDRYAGVPSTP